MTGRTERWQSPDCWHPLPVRNKLRLRVYWLAIALLAFGCYLSQLTDAGWGFWTGGAHLIGFPLFALFLFATVNFFFKDYFPKGKLTPQELTILYAMLVSAGTVVNHDMSDNLFAVVSYPFWRADATNNWDTLFFPHIPKWLVVTDRWALKGFYLGGTSFYQWDYIRAWLLPLTAWSGLIAVLIFGQLCLNSLLRRRWMDEERLGYPLTMVPLEVIKDERGEQFFKNPQAWLGFGLACLYNNFLGLRQLYGWLPQWRLSGWNLAELFPSRPWSAIGWTPVILAWSVVGLSFLLPLELTFSCWFFYALRKLVQVIASAFGQEQALSRGFPYWYEGQGTGAWIALAISVLWVDRRYLFHTVASAVQRKVNDRWEAMPSLLAILGILGAIGFAVAFGRAAGMSFGVALAFFSLYFLLSVSMTRVRAELGAPYELHAIHPARVLINLMGTTTLGAKNLTCFAAFYWFNRCYRWHAMPNQMEAIKLGVVTQTSLRSLSLAIMAAALFALPIGWWSGLHLYYEGGAEAKCRGFNWFAAHESWGVLEGWLKVGQPIDWERVGYMGLGAALVWGLMSLRRFLIWFPFHYAGYAVAITFAMNYYWFSFLVCWLVKLLVLRYGGIRLYRKLLTFFSGMIFGEYVTSTAWSIGTGLAKVQL